MKRIFILFLFSICIMKNAFADSFHDKILSVSSKFMGQPYLLNPLGEENSFDSKPLYREDFFDCLTFVETVLANVFSTNNLIQTMNEIRYKDGIVSFETRNHFQNPDWLKNNSKYLENISDE
ncbi:MAG: DUF1460 domain-containing protein, partial [Alphaproteobacteria bacterium]|nr:DUF1460 domain-containing protein [Alphaproteobacteria bacterium]